MGISYFDLENRLKVMTSIQRSFALPVSPVAPPASGATALAGTLFSLFDAFLVAFHLHPAAPRCVEGTP